MNIHVQMESFKGAKTNPKVKNIELKLFMLELTSSEVNFEVSHEEIN